MQKRNLFLGSYHFVQNFDDVFGLFQRICECAHRSFHVFGAVAVSEYDITHVFPERVIAGSSCDGTGFGFNRAGGHCQYFADVAAPDLINLKINAKLIDLRNFTGKNS